MNTTQKTIQAICPSCRRIRTFSVHSLDVVCYQCVIDNKTKGTKIVLDTGQAV